jgi:hypothetical protein
MAAANVNNAPKPDLLSSNFVSADPAAGFWIWILTLFCALRVGNFQNIEQLDNTEKWLKLIETSFKYKGHPEWVCA